MTPDLTAAVDALRSRARDARYWERRYQDELTVAEHQVTSKRTNRDKHRRLAETYEFSVAKLLGDTPD